MDELTYAWAPITKAEEQDDGTFLVYGPAASSHLDRDKQRLNSQWLDKAMPAWFADGANVREQHDAKRAVGVGVGLVKGDGDSGHMLASHIVDPVACLKVKHRVLKGYSVGIKNPRVKLGKADAPGGEVVGGDIVEVSIVDRPCNPTTLFELAKADGATGELEAVDGALVVEKTDAAAFGIAEDVYEKLPDGVRTALNTLAAAGASVSAEAVKAEDPVLASSVVTLPSFLLKIDGPPLTEEMVQGLVDQRVAERLAELGKADLSAAGRRKAAASGVAMADGSYPISSKADLRKAIRAVGRGNADHDAIRKHIVKRAKALGLEGMVPADWNADGSVKNAAKADGGTSAATDDRAALIGKAEEVLRDVRALVPDLAKADDGEASDGGDGGAGGGDEAEDVASATQAIACIAQLIISEAESLAQGNLHEALDISLLLDAVRALKWFNEREQMEQDAHALDRSDRATTTKADATSTEVSATTETTTTSEAGQAPEAPLTKADVAELVKSALAEAGKTQEERIEALKGELTKATQTIEELKAQPAPGGPVLTRTAAEAQAARKSDADRLTAEADDLLAKADNCTDRDLRDGYLERRRELLAKADA
ncbi:hypothetical protein ACFUEN_28845 [Streptomyces griseorubiginosus]|uniref:hypothetical protein n=1 Tax=Streptomyces griseorubiginosus TaxID=67304 RepID=UPI00363043DD